MATLSPIPKLQVIDASGAPIVGALLYTYESGTSTPLETYTDSTGVAPATNPLVSDSNGYIEIWIGSSAYKYILTDGVGATLFDPTYIEGTTIYTVDNITTSGTIGTVTIVENIDDLKALPEGNINDIVNVLGYYNKGDGGGGVFYWNANSSATVDNGYAVQPNASTSNGLWIREIDTEINVRWYGAKGDGSDDTDYFVTADAFCETGDYTLLCDAGVYLWGIDPALVTPIRLLPNAILKWSAAINPAINPIIDPTDRTQHFDDGGNSPVFPRGFELNVLWYGAIGDGSIDDTAAFQKASIAVPIGGTLYIPSAINNYYSVGSNSDYVITLKNGIKIKGDGDQSLLQVIANTNSSYAVIGHDITTALTDIKIEGIAINGVSSLNSSAGTAILINSVGGYIRNCNIYNNATCGINSYSKYFTIEDNVISQSNTFIKISQGDNTTVRGNSLVATTQDSVLSNYGISVTPETSREIINTFIINNILVGVPIYALAVPTTKKITSLVINENTVDLSAMHGYLSLSCITCLEAIGNVQIARNLLYSQNANTGGGIYCGSVDTARSLQMDISDNVIRLSATDTGSLHNGINLSWSSGAVIKGNNIRFSVTSADYAIYQYGTCTNTTFGVNQFINCGTIYPDGGATLINNRLALRDSGNITTGSNTTLKNGSLNTLVAGASTVNLIDSTGWSAGGIAILEFTGVITIKHNYGNSGVNRQITFKSGQDFVSSATTTLVLKYDGTSWKEVYTVTSGLVVSEATNGRMGVAVVPTNSGSYINSLTVSNTSITANTRIFLTIQSITGTSPGVISARISNITASTSFEITVNFTVTGGTSCRIAYLLVEPL